MNDPPTMNDMKKVNKTLIGSAGEVLCEKKLIEGFLRGRAGIV